mmetsp:Transcript_7830/g.21967  ORF Transcript_7830/g.21967 Transcript_7830/m.21967 type:complete len:267 (-) Transcript_7830:1452-2252(-)
MFVMHDPRKTSSIFVPATSDNVRASSGSFGAQRIGSLISLRSISMTSAYSALASASSSSGFSRNCSMRATRRCKVRASPYPSATIHLSMTMLLRRYSHTGSGSSLMEQPAADLSADASDSSKACSHLRWPNPSISRTLPEKTFFLPCFSTVNNPRWIAAWGIACTRSRNVMPGCMSPVKRTNTDSGISKGITPVAAAKATKPDPAGKEMPTGKRVCESPPVPTVSGNSMRLSQEWMMPSPGRRETPPLVRMKSGNVACVTTSTGLG